MANLPTYTTDRLILRERNLDDLPSLLEMGVDPEVMKFFGGPVPDLAAHELELRSRIATNFGDGLGFWSVFPRKDPSCYLGWILLIPLDSKGPEIEIGWRFARHAWGNGYATEAALEILKHGFSIGLESIVAVLKPENYRSIAVTKKLGMKYVGERHAYGSDLHLYNVERLLVG